MGFFSRSRSSRTDVDRQTVANTAANTPEPPAYSPPASMLKTKSRVSTTSSTSSSRPSMKSRRSSKMSDGTTSDITSLIDSRNPHKREKPNRHNSHDQHLIDCWKQANGHHYSTGQDSTSPPVFWSWS
ncbi:uncharacterized protein AB675_9183 [Cyphellophora attinorum]|uniref:Uncharacterized protein n=1 Tax=Cyphellophora attinorum TaxID=1664694 RepID=A0A0N1HBU6_9EURO|nr:uncharacterized protein AB675_9183 [Phialophora attinorum]KPI41610.1 hypothetical protein AB675_9183 [Phialophora attinorum]